MSGKFVYIPDDHTNVAFEVTLPDILRMSDPMTIPDLTCIALEEVLSACGWESRYDGTVCYIIKVFPELEPVENTWEPLIHFTFSSGVAKELSMSEFLIAHYPVAKEERAGLLS